jgi:poly(hydroxyalkanoate) depolymerase family esterase
VLKNPFLKKLIAASRMTRQGKLAEATLAIQRALSGGAQARTHTNRPSRDTKSVVEAEVVDPPVVLDGLVRETRPARPATGTASPATDAASATARFLASSFTGAAGTRAFKLFSPGGFAGESLPLVVMLHGCTQDPDDFAAGTRMNERAQEEGFFVLYPAQAARSNSHKCWNWFSPADQRRGAGEPALLAGMVRHVLQTHPIDPDRIYVAGLSAGGAMAAILASEYPDLFAAAGVHSGLPAGAAQDVASAFTVMKQGPGPGSAATGAARKRRPVTARSSAASLHAAAAPAADDARPGSAPVIVFHGDADGTVAASNGDAVIAAVLADAPGAVAEPTASAATTGRRRVRRTVWRAAEAHADAPTIAEQWVVHGAPHAWSGGASAGSYTDPDGPDASREMVRFFLAHPRRRA